MKAGILAIHGTILGLLALAACDDKPPPGKAAATASSASVPPAPTAEAPKASVPQVPQLAIDESGASVGGDRVDFTAPDPKGRLGTALAGKPVANAEVVLDAARSTKTSKVTTLFSALTAAKVKSVRVHTPKRDGSPSDLVFALGQKLPDCAGVGMIGKDLAIRAWAANGASSARFSKGMAGPDNTLGSAGIRKIVDRCDAPSWGITADENVTWGLLVDLAISVLVFDDAGPPKAKDLVLLPTSVVAGRKIDAEL